MAKISAFMIYASTQIRSLTDSFSIESYISMRVPIILKGIEVHSFLVALQIKGRGHRIFIPSIMEIVQTDLFMIIQFMWFDVLIILAPHIH